MTNNERVFNKLFESIVGDINFWMENGYSFKQSFKIALSNSCAGPSVINAVKKEFGK